MTDADLELAFALDALARPDDLVTRMAYADWLSERGDPRGELLALRCRVAGDESLLEREKEMSGRPGLVWMEHHGLPLSKELFLALFRRSLAEAVAWHHSVPLLRPAELRPPWDDHEGYFYCRHEAERPLIIRHVVATRAGLLAGRDNPDRGTAGGRLLYFWPDQTLHDEAAMAMTDYFAGDSSPPWEKWIWFVGGRLVKGSPWGGAPSEYPVLVAWVPPEYLDTVQLGMNVDVIPCIMWADDVDIELTHVLQAGLVP